MPRLNFPQFCESLSAHLDARKPFSLVRAGDGEGIVIGYPGLTPLAKLNKRLDKWFGSKTMGSHDKLAFCEAVRTACKNATMLGIPGARHDKINQDWRNVNRYLEQLGCLSESREVFCMDCTVDLHRHKLYTKMLKGFDTLYCIGCRDLAPQLKRAFGLREVNTYLVPPQNVPYRSQPGIPVERRPHYPLLYTEILRWIDEHARGNLFFVGAGGLGKIYCDRVRDRGGMAVDVGSMFDGWAGLVTRSYLKSIREFRL
jgi:hypothetical protein